MSRPGVSCAGPPEGGPASSRAEETAPAPMESVERLVLASSSGLRWRSSGGGLERPARGCAGSASPARTLAPGVVLLEGAVGAAEAGPNRWPSLRRRQRAAGGRLAREALGALTGLSPRRFSLERDPRGRPVPRLDGRRAPGLFVSIAHTGPRVLAAAARRPIGVDVEGPIPSSALDGLAFAPEVRRRLEAAPPEARPRLRAEAWCTLEAVGKLRGVGLAAPFAELSPRGLTRVVGQARGGETWVAVHGDIERVHA